MSDEKHNDIYRQISEMIPEVLDACVDKHEADRAKRRENLLRSQTDEQREKTLESYNAMVVLAKAKLLEALKADPSFVRTIVGCAVMTLAQEMWNNMNAEKKPGEREPHKNFIH